MGIDLSTKNLREDELLPLLGEGDWLLTLPPNYPDLLVSVAWRQERIESAACWFVRWVIAEQEVKINHDWDPPWDHSGHAEHYPADWRRLLARYETLDGWLDGECTGNSRASYASGMGLFWDTYGEDLREQISAEVFHLMKKPIKPPPTADEDEFWDEFFEDIDLVQTSLEWALRLKIGQIKTREAWKNFERAVREQIAAEEAEREVQAARYEKMRRQVTEFWEYYFPDLHGIRIEKPEFKAMNMAARLKDVLADTDPEVVKAIVEIGLPGLFSNTVTVEIHEIARQALTD